MGVLHLGHDEVRNCRVLAWLLDPLGAHGLGDRFLRSFLVLVNDSRPDSTPIELSDLDLVRILVEEARGDTRADIVIYGATWCVLIEAKIFAAEGRQQLTRLAELWAPDDGELVCVFLTRDRHSSMISAGDHQWDRCTWRELAGLVRACLEDGQDAQLDQGHPGAAGRPAAYEYLRAMETYLT